MRYRRRRAYKQNHTPTTQVRFVAEFQAFEIHVVVIYEYEYTIRRYDVSFWTRMFVIAHSSHEASSLLVVKRDM